MPPFRILILSDGRAGHFNLSEGIAAAVERVRPSLTERKLVKRGRWPGLVLAGITRLPVAPSLMLSLVYGTEETVFPACDLVVSAGAETLAASVWLARARGVPNIHYGSLRNFRPEDFSLVLTSYARQSEQPRHALALKPSRLDPDKAPPRTVPPAASAWTIALLIGGPSGEVRFATHDWDRLVGLMTEAKDTGRVRWLVANSRRTPESISDKFAEHKIQQACGINQFLDVRSAGPGTLTPLLAQSHAVICTADSSSMISECIWSRRPTLSLAPNDTRFTTNERAYREWLKSNGWCDEVKIETTTATDLLDRITRLRPIRNNPLDELSALIERRIPSLSSPQKQNAPQ